jgi:hypothetical protein
VRANGGAAVRPRHAPAGGALGQLGLQRLHAGARLTQLLCSTRSSAARSSTSTSMAATEAVTSESTASPSSTTATAKALDQCVVGTMSP